MINDTHSHARALEIEDNSRTMAVYFGISLFFHLILIGYLVFSHEWIPRRHLSPGSIKVSLVSLPGPPAAATGPAEAPAAEVVAIPKPEVKPVAKAPVIETPPPEPPPVIPKVPKTVSLAPKSEGPKVKKSLKKQSLNREKMIESAVSKVQEKVENTRADALDKALENLKKKVAQTEAGAGSNNRAARGANGAGAAGVQGGGIGGKRALEIIDIYKIEVAFQVERHWAFSEQLVGNDRALQASLVFKVMPTGDITDIRFTERSGNSYLDESAYRAIVKASPVAPHPEGVDVPSVTVALRFTPQGMR